MFIQKVTNGTEIRPMFQKACSRVAEILSPDTRVPILSSVTVQVSCSGKLGENISFNNAFKSLFLFINIVSCKRLRLLLKYIALVLMSHNCFNHSFVTAFVKISNSSIQYLFNLTWWNFSITCKVRGVFRTQTNISNGAFLKFLNYFLKKAPS